MVVCAIMAVIMTIAVPSIYRRLHPESMQKAVSDVMEACSHARATAILNGVETELVIRPFDRQIEVAQVGGSGASTLDRLASPSVSGGEWRMPEETGVKSAAGFSVKLSDKIIIEGLGVNGEDWTEDEVARVRFYPNGTSDELSMVLLSEKMERRNITLEVVTALADVESDPNKFKAR